MGKDGQLVHDTSMARLLLPSNAQCDLGNATCCLHSCMLFSVLSPVRVGVLQGYETALQLALHNGHVIIATHGQNPFAHMPADEIDGPG